MVPKPTGSCHPKPAPSINSPLQTEQLIECEDSLGTKNFPPPPPLTKKEIQHRGNIIKALGICLKCLNPRFTLKTKADKSRHERDECTVAKHNRKDKYTCLNEECFLHSWVCTAHRGENRPLFETHMN